MSICSYRQVLYTYMYVYLKGLQHEICVPSSTYCLRCTGTYRYCTHTRTCIERDCSMRFVYLAPSILIEMLTHEHIYIQVLYTYMYVYLKRLWHKICVPSTAYTVCSTHTRAYLAICRQVLYTYMYVYLKGLQYEICVPSTAYCLRCTHMCICTYRFCTHTYTYVYLLFKGTVACNFCTKHRLLFEVHTHKHMYLHIYCNNIEVIKNLNIKVNFAQCCTQTVKGCIFNPFCAHCILLCEGEKLQYTCEYSKCRYEEGLDTMTAINGFFLFLAVTLFLKCTPNPSLPPSPQVDR